MSDTIKLHPLEKNFVAPKPRQEAPEARIAKLAKEGRLYSTRKRDGYGGIVIATGMRRSPIALYTRGIQEITEKFPAVVEAIRSLAVPKETLGMCEFFWSHPKDDVDDLGTFSRFAKSSTEKAVALQRELGSPRCMLFTPLIARGQDLSRVPYTKRVELLAEWLDKKSHPLISMMEHLPGSIAELQAHMRKHRWEGLVFYDGAAGTEFRTDGKHDLPPRPDGCWKWKPIFEEDFVATKFEPGTGKNTGLAGKIYIAQIHPKNGKLMPCGEVVLHKQEHKVLFANAKIYPLVVEVEYEIRTPRGALRTASVLRDRDDKGIGECILPEQYH